MLKSRDKKTVVRLAPALVLLSSVLLTACQSNDPADFADPQSTAFYDRYPIKVKQVPVKMGVAAHGGTLQPEQINAVANFASDARENASSKIMIRWPSGSTKSHQAASDIAQLLVEEGVSQAMIVAASYPGGASAPVQLSFERKVAVTRECGNWSENLATTYDNQPYPNFGCAEQQNVAAMVANPEDFEHPRASSPVLASNRTAAMTIYIKNGTAGDYWTHDGTIKSGR